MEVGRKENLRKQVFAAAITGSIDFDALLDEVLANIPEARSIHTVSSTSPTSAPNT